MQRHIDSKGFSLIEVIMALGLVGLLTLGLTDLIGFSVRSSNLAESHLQLSELQGRVITTLEKPDGCTQGFTQSPQTIDFSTASGSGQEIEFKTNTGEVLKTGDVVNGSNLQIDRVYIANAKNLGPDPATGNTMVATDLIMAASTTKQVSGSKSFRPMKMGSVILALNASNTIISCAKEAKAAVSQTCASLGGNYDATSGQCLNVGGEACGGRAHGEMYEESCPAGYVGSVTKQCWHGNIQDVASNCMANCPSVGLRHGETRVSSACGAGKVGSISAQCWNGNLQTVSDTCAIVMKNCGTTAHGDTTTGVCPVGQTGTITYLCNDGSLNQIAANCLRSCSGGATSGQVKSVTCPAGQSGSVTQICENGSWKDLTSSCLRSCGTHASDTVYTIACPSSFKPGGTQTCSCHDGHEFCNVGTCEAKTTPVAPALPPPKPTSTCFTADTLVRMANGKNKEIWQVQIGDLVLGQNGEQNRVIEVRQTPLGNKQLLSFNGGPYFVTPDHPVFTEDGWKAVDPDAALSIHGIEMSGVLKEGDVLRDEDGGAISLTSIEGIDENPRLIVFNLILEGGHTYFANGILVHNKGGHKSDHSGTH